MILTSFHRHFRLVFTPNSTQYCHTLGKRKVFFPPRLLPQEGGWCLLMAPSDVPPRKCSQIIHRRQTGATVVWRAWEAARQRELFCSHIQYEVRSAVVVDAARSGTWLTDRCHLAPDAGARCVINTNMITISTNRPGGYCWSGRNSPECLQLSLN